jgi:hypothetical protein
MDEAKQFVAALATTLRDRLGNPLVSAFSIAWLIWNFRIVLVLVGTGDGGWKSKIDYLDRVLMVPASSWLWHGLLIPLVIALVWIFALPWVLRKIAIAHEMQANKTKEALLTARNEAPISAEERAVLWSKMHAERKAWGEERKELLAAIDQLQQTRLVSPADPDDGNVLLPGTPTATSATLEHEPVDDDFFGLTTIGKAEILGLNLVPEMAGTGAPTISFNDYHILWPWRVRNADRAGLLDSAAKLINGRSINEVELMMMFALRQGEGYSAAMQGLDSLGLDRFAAQASLDALRELRLVDFDGRKYSIAAPGRLVLAWMLRLGFTFNPPNNMKL